MARVTVSLPDAILLQLDELAAHDGVTRSDVVREASARYLVARDEETESREREAAVREGLDYLTRLADLPVLDDRPTIEILREIRQTDDSAPLRDASEHGEQK